MKLVLREDVEKLGTKGDIVDVADGYGRNFLLPRGLAIVASRGVVKQAESMRRSRSTKEARDREQAQALASKLVATRIIVKARAGEGGRLFGSVTTADVADAVEAQMGVAIDRRKLHIADAVKELGPVEVSAKLHNGVEITINVDVEAE
jgi:large subunit ribosomal protein L9